MAFRVFGIAAAVFGLAVGLVDVVTGALRGNVWQAIAGVALTFLAAVLLLTLDDARPSRGVRARWAPDLPDDGVFALGVRMRGRDGAFRPLLVHVRTRRRGDWWMALECTPGQLRELADLLRPYAVGETDEPVGQSGAEAGVVPACTLDRLLNSIHATNATTGGDHDPS